MNKECKDSTSGVATLPNISHSGLDCSTNQAICSTEGEKSTILCGRIDGLHWHKHCYGYVEITQSERLLVNEQCPFNPLVQINNVEG